MHRFRFFQGFQPTIYRKEMKKKNSTRVLHSFSSWWQCLGGGRRRSAANGEAAGKKRKKN
jgi:hypothetical protein